MAYFFIGFGVLMFAIQLLVLEQDVHSTPKTPVISNSLEVAKVSYLN